MEQRNSKKEIISKLQQEILHLEGFKPAPAGVNSVAGLGPVESAFPNKVFPTGALHEFLNLIPEQSAASGGFIAGLLKTLMQQGSLCIWISSRRVLFPPALKAFGVEPDRIIFVDLAADRDVLWAMEEALKCEGLSAVIGEVRELTFTQSRRLQLAIEKSQVTGFVLRSDERKLGANACVARWKISPISSVLEEGMPGVGFPRWNVELLKVRNGNPGIWQIEWSPEGFKLITQEQVRVELPLQERKTG
ncbi:ImuA family protein [Pedobacter sp. SYSU D00535]|uniref:ImuA family protein n=1 Tax=Pedobacter sp. SYSU D00535 TaxID=2810308 RepID=UPI001A96A8CD|nr:Error-prone repair protein ImuA [Pedobacter sp. SYSU D00535]